MERQAAMMRAEAAETAGEAVAQLSAQLETRAKQAEEALVAARREMEQQPTASGGDSSGTPARAVKKRLAEVEAELKANKEQLSTLAQQAHQALLNEAGSTSLSSRSGKSTGRKGRADNLESIAQRAAAAAVLANENNHRKQLEQAESRAK
eukprot:gene30449-38059_t